MTDDTTRRSWVDRLLLRPPPPDWPAIGHEWEDEYPALTAAGVHPWDFPDMGVLDGKIADLVRFAVEAERNRIRSSVETLLAACSGSLVGVIDDCNISGRMDALEDVLAAVEPPRDEP